MELKTPVAGFTANAETPAEVAMYRNMLVGSIDRVQPGNP